MRKLKNKNNWLKPSRGDTCVGRKIGSGSRGGNWTPNDISVFCFRTPRCHHLLEFARGEIITCERFSFSTFHQLKKKCLFCFLLTGSKCKLVFLTSQMPLPISRLLKTKSILLCYRNLKKKCLVRRFGKIYVNFRARLL